MSDGKHIDPSTLTDFPVAVGRIVQEKFFPWPPTRWETLSPHQRQDFIECGVEILAMLRRYGWTARVRLTKDEKAATDV